MNQPNTVYQGDQSLPPAGYERQETLKQNADNLAEQAEKIADAHDVHRVDPSTIEPDREILGLIDALQVTNAVPGYRYKWVQDQWPSHAKSLEVRRTRGIHVKVNGKVQPAWEVVLHDMPESAELKQVGGERRVGDCILMRCRSDIYMILQQQEKIKRDRQVLGVTAEFDDLARQGRDKGIKVTHGNMERSDLRNMQSNQIAKGQFDGMVRDGNIPGMEMPNNRR